MGLGHDEQDRSAETSRRAGFLVADLSGASFLVKTFDVMLIIVAGGSPVLVGLHGLRVSRQRCSSALPRTGRILVKVHNPLPETEENLSRFLPCIRTMLFSL